MTQTVPPGIERSRINPGLFRLALVSSMAGRPRDRDGRLGVTQQQVSRESGVNTGRISELVGHGKLPSLADCIALLGWMHIDTAMVLDPPEPKADAKAEPAATAA